MYERTIYKSLPQQREWKRIHIVAVNSICYSALLTLITSLSRHTITYLTRRSTTSLQISAMTVRRSTTSLHIIAMTVRRSTTSLYISAMTVIRSTTSLHISAMTIAAALTYEGVAPMRMCGFRDSRLHPQSTSSFHLCS